MRRHLFEIDPTPTPLPPAPLLYGCLKYQEYQVVLEILAYVKTHLGFQHILSVFRKQLHVSEMSGFFD